MNEAETISTDLSEVLNALQLIESNYMKGRFQGTFKKSVRHALLFTAAGILFVLQR